MMMKEISLHILDIVQNSITAGSSLITIEVTVDHAGDLLYVGVMDNGSGMAPDMAQRALSPFTTSRTTRKVGLGIPMFKAGAEATGGSFSLASDLGVGTCVRASYRISHIDRPPLGDMAETMLAIVVSNPETDFVYDYKVDGAQFLFDTRKIRAALGEGVPLNLPDVVLWIKDCLYEGISELNGGV